MHFKNYILALLLPLFTTSIANADTDLVVNEIQVGNIDEFIDPSYNYGGWIELYNPSASAMTLSGMYISDDPENLKKYRLTTGVGSIAAKGYKVLWFDHNSADGTYGTGATTQIRFKLDADGGTIYLSDSNGNLLLSQTYPKEITRCSYARTTDGGSTWRWTGIPTPGSTNNGSVYADEQLQAPVVSHDSGIMEDAIKVTCEIPSGVTIRYTADGSTPTASVGSTLTANGINVNDTKVLRFRAYKQGYLPSAVVTRTYLFPDKDYTLPIVSVVTNKKNLYDNTIGVYTIGTNGVQDRGINYKSNKNMDWERPVNFEYFDADGRCLLNQEATFYVSGGWSRHWEPTSFKLKTEKRYDGENYFQYQFFDQKPFNKNRCIILRNGGNDTDCRLKDGILQTIIQSSGLYLDGQAFNPCHVFLNGKYLAMLNMREPSNKFFAFANYGIDTDAIDAFEMQGGQKLKAGTSAAWTKLLSLANKASYADTYEDIAQNYLEIDEYANYMAAFTWLGCGDWITNNNNVKWFRSIDNGRFHFVMFDTDSAFENSSMLTTLKTYSSNNVANLFNRMTKSSDFRTQFITAYCMMPGAVFTAERTSEVTARIGNLTASALAIDGKNAWNRCTDMNNRVTNTSGRNQRMNALKSYFSLGNGFEVSINANIPWAQILINGQVVPGGKFSGTLFESPVITASAPAGYNFVGWRKAGQNSTALLPAGSSWYYYDKGSLDGVDWKTGSVNWSNGKAPLGYSKDGLATTIGYGGNSSNKYPTYYFRSSLELDSKPATDDVIKLNYTVDDGMIVYVNGKEAGRYLMPQGTVTYSTFATSHSTNNPDTGEMVLDNSLFRKGTNIIAVEVHNNSATSTDIYFDGEIALLRNNGEISTTERTVVIEDNFNGGLTAVFEPLPEECLIAAGSTPVVVNEVSAANSIFVNEYYKKNDWIELYNTTDEDIDLTGMYLSDDPSNPHKYQISPLGDSEVVVSAHGYYIIWADKLDPLTSLHTGFKLGNSDDECVIITAADDSWSDRLTYKSHAGDWSFGRFPDGGKRTYSMSRPTIGKKNTLTYYSVWADGEDENFDVEAYLADIDTPVSTPKTATGVYDLQGRRLGNSTSALAPGIYIVNGKKTIIK